MGRDNKYYKSVKKTVKIRDCIRDKFRKKSGPGKRPDFFRIIFFDTIPKMQSGKQLSQKQMLKQRYKNLFTLFAQISRNLSAHLHGLFGFVHDDYFDHFDYSAQS